MAKGTKDQIYHGALEAFSQYGYAETKMDVIAELAGVVKRTLYYNFSTKEELFVYVMKRGIGELTQRLDDAITSNQSFEEKWTSVIHSQLSFFEQNQKFCRLLLQNVWGANVQGQLTLQEPRRKGLWRKRKPTSLIQR